MSVWPPLLLPDVGCGWPLLELKFDPKSLSGCLTLFSMIVARLAALEPGVVGPSFDDDAAAPAVEAVEFDAIARGLTLSLGGKNLS